MCSGVASLPICPAADPEPRDGSPLIGYARVSKKKKQNDVERRVKSEECQKIRRGEYTKERSMRQKKEKRGFYPRKLRKAPCFFCEHRADRSEKARLNAHFVRIREYGKYKEWSNCIQKSK